VLLARPSHSFLFNHPRNIWCRVQIVTLLIVYSSTLACYPSLLGPNTFLNTLFLNTLSLFLPHCERPTFTPIKNQRAKLQFCTF
jgi:hypothetical protein